MTQIISRFYQARENADAAVADLLQSGFDDTMVNVVAPAEAPDDEALASIRRGGVVATHGDVYVEGIKRGETLVSVRALFGLAAKATRILEKHGPTETAVAEQSFKEAPVDPAAPFSSAYGWRVLLDDPAPLSSWLKLPLLSTRRTPPKPDAKLADNPAPFSKATHWPVLTEQPAMLSSAARLPVLSDDPAPLSTRVKWPPLSKEQKPPPVRFGLRLLSDDPAPLSTRLGLKVLLNDPAPLSRLLRWRVLPGEPRT